VVEQLLSGDYIVIHAKLTGLCRLQSCRLQLMDTGYKYGSERRCMKV